MTIPSESSSYIGHIKNTPLGNLWVAISDLGLTAVAWGDNQHEFEERLNKRLKRSIQLNEVKIAPFANQIKEYLNRSLRQFTIPIDWSVLSSFQQIVLKTTFEIPYGQTRTYSELAGQIGRPNAARAVGRAQATNPIPLVIPCHRVIGVNGKLTGYGGGEGLPTKEWLLKMEGAVIA